MTQKGAPGAIGLAAVGGSWIDVVSNIVGLTPNAQSNASFERTSAHEFGHSAGLLHPGENGAPGTLGDSNLMSQTRFTGDRSTNKGQIEQMYRDYNAGNLNQ